MSLDRDTKDTVDANRLAFKSFIEAALVTILTESDSPQSVAEKIGKRAKRNAEGVRKSLNNAAVALQMEDNVINMARDISIAVSGFEGKSRFR